jgi:hypothetical protein
MGLLDDAIREHLELKRLGGADPGEVAREEQDALGPVRREGEVAQSAEEPAEINTPTDTGRSFADAEPTAAADFSPVQETVEINMEAELSGGSDSESDLLPPRSEHAAPVAQSAHAQGAVEDSLEWEVPSESRPDPSSSGGEEHPKPDGNDEDGEHVEDVLEETPDFLRDTPEQERLWFEQRPPRDFDFNE